MLAAALLQGYLLFAAVGVRTNARTRRRYENECQSVLAQLLCTATPRFTLAKIAQLAHFKTLAFPKLSLKKWSGKRYRR